MCSDVHYGRKGAFLLCRITRNEKMEHSINFDDVAECLLACFVPAEGASDVLRALLCELAKGGPVTREALAAVLDWPAQRVAAVLEQVPSIEYDDGKIVGHGLTLRETSHVFEIDCNRLYTWSALDTLMFPALMGKTARVRSRCAATGAPVSLTVAPHAVRDVKPLGAVVSLVLPEAASNIRRAFCCHVRFFVSVSAANAWVSRYGRAAVVSVEDAFRLGQDVARRLSLHANAEAS